MFPLAARGSVSVLRYLALGDSFTIGTGIANDLAFPAVLARRWAARGIRSEVTNPAVNRYATESLPCLARAEVQPVPANLRVIGI